jgi:hypothetical protein
MVKVQASKPTKKTPPKKVVLSSTTVEAQNGREMLYPEIRVDLRTGDNALTVQEAKDLLGWSEGPGDSKTGCLLKDRYGKAIWCLNNIPNRPLTMGDVETLVQEHLRRRWVFNFETIIVGKSGRILNGQHSLISLILASQDWEKDKDKYEGVWDVEPTMEKLIGFGCSEDSKTINTMDTCKARTFAHVVFMSPFLEKVKGTAKRNKIAKVCEYALRLLWERTGTGNEIKKRTHAESFAFLENHPRLIQCVLHVIEENGEGTEKDAKGNPIDKNKISRYLALGSAAGMMYLMGSGATEIEAYKANPREESLDWELWEQAQDFFVEIASGSKKVSGLDKTVKELLSSRGSLSLSERKALLAKSWIQYLESGEVGPIKLKFAENEYGASVLSETPLVGGIDCGSGKDDAVPPSPKEIAERAEAIRAEKEAKAKSKPAKGKKGKPAIGDKVWIDDPDEGGYWFGTIIEFYDARGKSVAKIDTGDGVFDAPVANLLLTKPDDIDE